MISIRRNIFLYLLLVTMIFSCKMYKQDILFQLDDEFTEADLTARLYTLEQNYTVQPNDYLEIRVTTNKGELLIDPNFELMRGGGGGAGGLMQQNQRENPNIRRYLVQQDGYVKFPVVGLVYLVGLTILEAEAKLQSLYDEYYKESFVRLVFSNKRAFMLGANGGLVVPLENENTSLVELLALYGGLEFGSKGNNIKIIRGDLTNPEVFMVDISTISGLKASMVTIQPGDIIYVEPWRRVFYQGLRDVSPILSLVSSAIALLFVFSNL